MSEDSGATMSELVGFMTHARVDVRMVAVTHVLQVAAEPANWPGLKEAKAAPALARLVGDHPKVASVAVQCLINLSADSEFQAQMLKLRLVNSVMEALKDDACSFRRHGVMLLSNLCQTQAGCLQLMQKDERSDGSTVGVHLRRLLALFLQAPGTHSPSAPGSAAAASLLDAGAAQAEVTEGDDFEYAAAVLQNVTQDPDARTIILHPERGILEGLLGQLSARSVIRRRGVSAALRNCCLHEERPTAAGLLRPELRLVERVTRPLVGPEPFKPGERDTMPHDWLVHGPAKKREPDPATRRHLVETLVILTGSRDGRAELRRVNVYPVLRNLHYWLEGATELLEEVAKGRGEPMSMGTMVGSHVDEDGDAAAATGAGEAAADAGAAAEHADVLGEAVAKAGEHSGAGAARRVAEAEARAKEASAKAGFGPEAKAALHDEGEAGDEDMEGDDARTVDAIHQLVQVLKADEPTAPRGGPAAEAEAAAAPKVVEVKDEAAPSPKPAAAAAAPVAELDHAAKRAAAAVEAAGFDEMD
ncbi:hypothetical protein FNF29_02666 [Cafeteria roenbergensis]|uniref:Protein HGH1 homolog n=1 Tax=Cafeteria roenbergensis TaxID=33653 RepID=A0A5A8CLN5_CAFRO|nr:hypothetical protein FNF29_02666 [Cafeteria roenbergensis]|eukprot:KAA0154043.1 hypothetical protein FNF29_02666 [Cafeteria roenbergensis]